MAHTKGKLHLHDMEPATICAEDHISIADCNARRRLEEENRANAAHLVHCWNEHENLIELAKAVLFYHENFAHMKDVDLEKILDAASAAVGAEAQS